MKNHSVLPPSKAARRMLCSGSAALELKYPSEPTEQSIEGEKAHELAATMLLYKQYDANNYTQEMIDAATIYRAYVYRVAENIKDVVVEQQIPILNVHPDCFGTPDCWVITYTNELHVLDFKYGHKHVDVFENWQLLEYACGIYNLLEEKPIKIYLHIVQPRCYTHFPTQMWGLTDVELHRYMRQLILSEAAASQPKALCRVNPLCRTCSAKHACPTLQTAALSAIDFAYENTPAPLNTHQLDTELKLLTQAKELIESRMLGLEVEAINLLKKGERLNNFALEETKPRQYWKATTEELKILGDLFDVEVFKKPEPITPKQAEKQGIPRQILKDLVETPTPSLKLKLINEQENKKLFNSY